jgi:hypothetical protein
MWPENARPRAETSGERYLPVGVLGAPTAGAGGVVADAGGRALVDAEADGVGVLGSRSGGQGNS